MNTLPPSAQNGKPSICWKCLQPPDHSHFRPYDFEKNTKLCPSCYQAMLSNLQKHRRRSRKNNADSTLTINEWIEVLLLSEGHCYYCKEYIGYRYLTLDHKIPIVKGGATSVENIVVACRRCNSSKGTEVAK